jgi:PAS domain S-box-containing protein
MCVVHVSTASISIGIILNCNSEVRKYLGYDKHELINQKVTKIMPKIFSEIHDGFIVEYLKKADSVKLPS